jgi:hypothetical protein
MNMMSPESMPCHLEDEEKRRFRGWRGRPSNLKLPVAIGPGSLFVSKIYGRPSRARKDGRTGHRWLEGDFEAYASPAWASLSNAGSTPHLRTRRIT